MGSKTGQGAMAQKSINLFDGLLTLAKSHHVGKAHKLFTAYKSKSCKHTPTQLLITDIMSQMLSAFMALSLFVLSVDFNFYHYLFGGGFRRFQLLGSGFHTTAHDSDIQARGFSIFIGHHGFHGFQFLGGPMSQTCLSLAIHDKSQEW